MSWQRPKKALKPQNFQNKLFHLIQAPFLLINGQNEESFMYFENESFYPNMTVGSLIKPCFWSRKFLVKWYCYDIDTQLCQYFAKIREDQNGMMTTSFPFAKKKKGRKYCFGALKIDMSKAFDKVHLKFQKVVLVAMNFSPRWIGWVKECF